MFCRDYRCPSVDRLTDRSAVPLPLSARVVLDSIGDAVVSTDLAGKVTYINPVAERMTGWSAPRPGRPLRDVVRIIDAYSREPVRDPLAMAMRKDDTVGLGDRLPAGPPQREETAIEDTAAPMHDRDGRVIGAVIVFHDVAPRVRCRRMSHLAQHDALTGLPNRLLLDDRLDRAMASARRRATELAVLFMDVDRFKSINDFLGHAVGDEVLKSIARRLTEACESRTQ